MTSQNMLDFGSPLAPGVLSESPESAQMSEQDRTDVIPGVGHYVIKCKRCGRMWRKSSPRARFCVDACRAAWRHERQGEIEGRKKVRAMKGSAAINAEYLAIARKAANRIRLRDGDCDADRVHLLLEDEGTVLPSGGWWGSLFKNDPAHPWTKTERLVRSRHKGSKNRETRVWQ